MYCDRAIAIAEANGDLLTVADAGLTSAIADRRRGRTSEAAAAAELAATRFADVGALDWAIKAYTVAAECHDEQGDDARAAEARARAAGLSGTSDRLPRGDRRPDP